MTSRRDPRVRGGRGLRRILGVALPLAGLLLLLWPASLPGIPGRARVLDRNGELLFAAGARQTLQSLDELSPWVVPALVSTEDQRFYRHPGIDPVAVVRAARVNRASGTIESGASTLTMQVARLAMGHSIGGWSDKIRQSLRAVRLEVWHSKEEILQAWLNEAYFGRGAFGIHAASRAWFDKTPADLSLSESAFLVGIPQRPERSLEDLIARRNSVLARMQDTGALLVEQARDAAALAMTPFAPRPSPVLAAHVAIPLLGRPRTAESIDFATSLDIRLQRVIEREARAHVARLAGKGIGNVAAVVLDNTSGEVLAWLGSADYFDEANLGANDGVRMHRQPGSTLKPFLYGAAFDAGLIGPSSILLDVETPFVEAGAAFSADNYDRRYHGAVPARVALASSFNIPAVALVDQLTPHAALGALNRAGLTSLNQSAEFYGVGLALGNGEVSLLELARSYAGLARGGVPPRLRLLGREPLLPPATGSLSPQAAFLVLDVLADPAARAPGFGRGGPLELPFPMAAKTGTSKDYRDNWAVGVTPAHTIAVWAGNFDGSPMQSVSGVTGAGTLLRAIALELGNQGAFPVPPGVSRVEVCVETGAAVSPSVACEVGRLEWQIDRVGVPGATRGIGPVRAAGAAGGTGGAGAAGAVGGTGAAGAAGAAGGTPRRRGFAGIRPDAGIRRVSRTWPASPPSPGNRLAPTIDAPFHPLPCGPHGLPTRPHTADRASIHHASDRSRRWLA